MNLVIERLDISNFKGIRDLSVSFGDVTHIHGANATGKTSIQDAFTWLLFNKDAEGNAPGSDNFREKPLDEQGNEVHNLDTTVTASFKLDGKPFILRRTQRESWVTKRGNAEAAYQGNVSTYWINDVETKSGDFKARVSGIASDEVFRLITSLGAFNAIEWKKRRSLLVSMSGADVDARLLATEEYAPVLEEVTQRSISVEDLRKVLSDQRKAANAELQLIPARIDEAHGLRPQITEQERKDAEYLANDTQADITKIDAMIAELQNGGDGADTRRQIVETEATLIRLRRDIDSDHQTTAAQLIRADNDAHLRLMQAQTENSNAARALEKAKTELERATTILTSCRSEYKAISEQGFVVEGIEKVCPACGQSIPEEAYEAAVAKAKAAYDAKKKNELAAITKRGNAAKEDCDTWKKRVEEAETYVKQAADLLESAQQAQQAAKEALASAPPSPDYTKDPRIAELQTTLETLRASAKDAPEEKIGRLKERQEELRGILSRAQATLAKAAMVTEIDDRIAALEAKQREYGEKVSDIEIKMTLVEKFVADRCKALEETINDMFPTVRWKLFDRQINGGLVDVCNCMIACETGLVAYAGANTAAKVNADIEIASVLSKHYGVTAPLFLDKAESVNYISSPAGQLITLSVSTDKTLTVEQKYKEAS